MTYETVITSRGGIGSSQFKQLNQQNQQTWLRIRQRESFLKGVVSMLISKKQKKKAKLRYAEYYGLTPLFDDLYARSQAGKTFDSLMNLIGSSSNIRLAYRNIKRNKGSKTAGTDDCIIADIESLSPDKVVLIVQSKLANHHPKPVRRVEILKPNGKKRPLGIPTIWDRLIQQCVLQVLEPICEAQFHERSNGFRPNRSAEHAIAQCDRMITSKACIM